MASRREAPAFEISNESEGGWQRLTLRGHGEVVPYLETVASAMASEGYSDSDILNMQLALEEALANAITHGNRNDAAKRVLLRFRVCPECVLAEVEDEGSGFDHRQVPDPTAPENLERLAGRGLFLMQYYTTWMRFNARGNCVTLCKEPSSPLPS